MPRYSTLERLTSLAEDQWGLITRRQAQDRGVPQTTLERWTADASVLERVARGIYRLTGTPVPNHLALRAAWLQLAPDVPAWQRSPEDGVVSHRSAAALYGLGDLPADRHEFTVRKRRQSRRPDVRLHTRYLEARECIELDGLPVTRPSRIASDLLFDHEDPEAVARTVVDAIRGAYNSPREFAEALAPHAARFGLRRGDGVALLRWLIGLVGDRDAERWLEEARSQVIRPDARSARPERTSRRRGR